MVSDFVRVCVLEIPQCVGEQERGSVPVLPEAVLVLCQGTRCLPRPVLRLAATSHAVLTCKCQLVLQPEPVIMQPLSNGFQILSDCHLNMRTSSNCSPLNPPCVCLCGCVCTMCVCVCTQLLGNILQWDGLLSSSTLKELALDSTLNRYILSALQSCHTGDEGIAKSQKVHTRHKHTHTHTHVYFLPPNTLSLIHTCSHTHIHPVTISLDTVTLSLSHRLPFHPSGLLSLSPAVCLSLSSSPSVSLLL